MRAGVRRQHEKGERQMIFVSIVTWEPEKRNDIIARRSENGHMRPPGIKTIGEWVDLAGCRDVLVFEADDPADLLASSMAWGDILKIETFTVMDAEEVMGAIK